MQRLQHLADDTLAKKSCSSITLRRSDGRPVGDPVTSAGLKFKVPFTRAQRADDEPAGVRGVSWTGEHNGDRVRHRSSGFHRRGFLFGALAAVATRVKLESN